MRGFVYKKIRVSYFRDNKYNNLLVHFFRHICYYNNLLIIYSVTILGDESC